ncbi:SDR family NAD(P)-dependent oxidoreductase [Bradyrhizobium uaiense]|uniref:SDR family NAD(P)-dependent oxidoreductase n=1 Tax=Bradyrhizobium uaiense TaxID=2594946 RepID=A0A6P1BM42_9BRAD|nr:SDR family NAD(P)-dependent oxidoreductase [Bradyrhizobium uaiense]NEU99587.1 SDR family NAD(P)-dependent oxidoreductase [Bradyrhizobium uaiense]
MNPMQNPLNTPFTPFSTAEEVARGADLSGKTAIITGGASGLGLETTRVLAGLGARIIVPARNTSAARASLAGITGVVVAELDLIDPISVRSFAEEFLTTGAQLHLLILSAGVMTPPLFRDVEGHEGQFATNHLGHFRLTAALCPALKLAGKARVVALSSRAHQLPGFDLTDLDFNQRPYDKVAAYAQSKAANALFALALDMRTRDHGIRAYSVHPGSILGNLARHVSREELEAYGLFNPDGTPLIDPAQDKKNFAQGAATMVWCATAPELDGIGGVYCEDSDIAPIETEGHFGIRPYAADPALAEALWTKSVRLTGIDVQG